MSEQFYCHPCGLTFSSWKELKEHRMTREHKDNVMSPMTRAEQILSQIATRLKRNGGKSNGPD